MANIDSYDYTELNADSGQGVIGTDAASFEARRAFLIAWSDLPAFLLALKGGWSKTGEAWQYVAPDAHPQFANAICIHVEWDHVGEAVSDSPSAWEHAVVKAKYGVLPYDATTLDPRDLITEDLDLGAEVRNLPGRSVKVGSGSDEYTVKEPVSVIDGVGTYSLLMHSVPAIPLGGAFAMAAYHGKVNSVEFRGAPAGTLLMEGTKISRTITTGGQQPGYRIELCFRVKIIGWNNVYNPLTGAVAAAITVNGGNPPYATADFNDLLPPR
jgi:hypothetical protein